MAHLEKIEEVRAHVAHLREQLALVRDELVTSGDGLATLEREQLAAALAEAEETERELVALEHTEAEETAALVYHADPYANKMAIFFVSLMGLWVVVLFITRWIG
jgi:multidrug resistance efflux pump